jgi:hypothetical protein
MEADESQLPFCCPEEFQIIGIRRFTKYRKNK